MHASLALDYWPGLIDGAGFSASIGGGTAGVLCVEFQARRRTEEWGLAARKKRATSIWRSGKAREK